MKKTTTGVYFLLSLIVGVIFSIGVYFGNFSGLDNFINDSFFTAKPIAENILVVGIDNADLQKYGQWPWNREMLALALQKMRENPPKALGVDLLLAENSRIGENDDKKLTDVLNDLNFPVVLAVEGNKVFLQNKNKVDFLLKPLNAFQNVSQVSLGHANIILDSDKVARFYPTKIFSKEVLGDVEIRSLAYETVKRSGVTIKDEDKMKLQERIFYFGPAQSVRTISFDRIFEPGANFWKDKIVFLGVTAPDLHDYQITPFSKQKPMAGVEIQANIANQLLSGKKFSVLPKNLNIVLVFISVLITAFFFERFKKIVWPILFSVGLVVVYYALAMVLFDYGYILFLSNIIFAIVFSAVGLFVYRFLVVEKEKRQIRDVFSKYVSKEVVREIMKNPEAVVLGGEEREITVFFSDIRGFTTISENMSSVKLVSLLNRYFTLMTDEIIKNRGTLDKYIGDAIMAFWGAPLNDDKQVDNALKTAVNMLKKLRSLNEELIKENLPEIKIGIGLFNGNAVVGNIGSSERLNYTAMGDTVNTASRLEGLNKEYNTQIIVGESVMKKAQSKYIFKFLGAVKVKGKNEEVNIYTIET